MNVSTKQRTISTLASAGAVCLMVAACGSANGGEGGSSDDSLLIYHDFDAVAIEPIVAAFNEHYTELTGESANVETYHQAGGELRVTLELEANSGDIQPDVVMIAHSELYALQEEFDLFADLDIEGMDDDAIAEAMRDPIGDGYTVTNSVQPYLLVYNTNHVEESEAPTSWVDLLDERWTNQLGMGDPESTSGAHLPLWFLVEHLGNEIGSPFGWEYYEQLGTLNPTTASSHDAIMEYVNAGELQIGILGLAQIVNAIESGQPVAAAVPDEGVPAFIHASAMTTTTEDQELAETFLEWVISAEGQEAIYAAYPALPSRTDVEATNLPFELAIDDVSPVDPEWISSNRAENIQHFRDAIGGSGGA